MAKNGKNSLDDEDYRVPTEERCMDIYLEGGGGIIWVNKEDHRNYDRINSANRQTRIDESRCLIPAERGMYKRCRERCSECSYHRTGNTISYDAIIENTGNELPDGLDIRADYELNEVREKLWAEVEMLSEVDQRILALYNEDYTEREIAQKVDLSQKAVNLRINKCIKLLREKLKDY